MVAPLLAWAVLAGPAVLAVPAGLLLALVLPGVAASSALFGRRLWWGTRAVLVPALSLAILILGGLILYAAGVRLDQASWTLLTVCVTLLAAGAAYLTGRRRPQPDAGQPDAAEGVCAEGASAESAFAEDASAESDSVGHGPVVPGRARRLALVGLIVVLLGGASWISLRSAWAQAGSPVTALSVASVGTVDEATLLHGVTITLAGTASGGAGYVLRIHTVAGFQSTIDSPAGTGWAGTVQVPAQERVTVDLYRAGDTSPYRTVFVAARS
jgi:hypothetical protein